MQGDRWDGEDGVQETIEGASVEAAQEEEEGGGRRGSVAGLPSWAISTALHLGLLLVLSFLVVATVSAREPEGLVTFLAGEKPLPPPVEGEIESDNPVESDEPPVEKPIFITDPKFREADRTETPDRMEDRNTAHGREDAIGTTDLGQVGLITVVGPGGGAAGQAGTFDGRGNEALAIGNGGSRGSLDAVTRGLKWLARHQGPDGRWDCGKHGGTAKDSHDVAATGLALLAFLGAGYTEETEGSALQKQFAPVVRRGLDWLVSRQGADGAFAANNYAHGMAALAVAEAFGMGSKRHGAAATRAVGCMVSRQKPGGGWDYGDKGDPGRDRSDTSITCWQVMALKSAKLSGVAVPREAIEKAWAYFGKAGSVGQTDVTGQVAYSIESGKLSKGGLAITAMTMLSAQFLGMDATHPFLLAGAGLLRDEGPKVTDSYNLYYTYYATMTMFQMGKDYFGPWNKGMRDPIVAHQVRDKGDDDGSWPPEKDQYGRDGGRVYSTAMALLCLEVYYRYLPVYQK